jgi:tetrahydromethanopterin S-methyltransferase subunit G
MSNEKSPEDCPLDHECAFEMIHSMKQAQADINKLKEELKEVKEMISDIHKVFLKFDGIKIGVRIGAWGVVATVITVFTIGSLFLTGHISLKDLINWLL